MVAMEPIPFLWDKKPEGFREKTPKTPPQKCFWTQNDGETSFFQLKEENVSPSD
jgi:hypothetical protein